MSLLNELDAVLAKIAERTDGDYLARLANGTNTAVTCVQFIRDNAAELREALANDARYRWLRDECDTTTGFLLGQRLEADEWDAAIDAARSAE